MQLIDKLSILADAAKYDASCASSAAPKRSSEGKSGLGSSTRSGKGPHSAAAVSAPAALPAAMSWGLSPM